VDGVYICDFCGGDDACDVEVGVFGGARSDADFFVCMLEVGGVFVCGGVHADGFDFEFLAGPHDAEGDFASVCYKHALEHVGSLGSLSELQTRHQ